MGRQAKLSALCLLAGAFALAGCGERQRRPDPPQTVTLSGVTACEAVNAAEAVLRQMRFSIDKADPDAGVVRTFPLTAGQFFEFWRSDNVDAPSALEANLQTLRRSVRVDLVQTDGQVRIHCAIRVQRLSLPENEVASVSQAYRIHSRSSPTTQRIDMHPSQREAVHWIELGDDPKLAAEILQSRSRIARWKTGEKVVGQETANPAPACEASLSPQLPSLAADVASLELNLSTILDELENEEWSVGYDLPNTGTPDRLR